MTEKVWDGGQFLKRGILEPAPVVDETSCTLHEDLCWAIASGFGHGEEMPGQRSSPFPKYTQLPWIIIAPSGEPQATASLPRKWCLGVGPPPTPRAPPLPGTLLHL